jgi:hypothetical protein
MHIIIFNIKSNNEELLKFDDVTPEEFIEFWVNPNQQQVDGRHKGGSWGLDNCLPWNEQFIGNKKRWLPGKFIRDEILFKILKRESNYDKVEIIETGDIAYVTSEPMPQVALDVILLINLNNEYYIKVLTRGNAPNVDMQGKITIGAGEHIEKKNGAVTVKTANRALEEELGNIGTYKDKLEIKRSITELIGIDNRENRDPRYSKYAISRGNRVIYCGYNRPSSSKVYVCYLEGNIKNTRNNISILNQIKGTNNVEIKGAKLVKLKDILIKYPLDKWGWSSHYIFLQYLNNFINMFDHEFKINQIEQIIPFLNVLSGGKKNQ